MHDREYWAKKEGPEFAKELYSRVDEFYADLETSGYFSMVRNSYRKYFGANSDQGSVSNNKRVTRTGKQGELHKIQINDFRNLLQHMLNMTTNPRPAMQARASNSDYKSQSQTILADGVLEYYMREKRIERYLIEATELGLVTGKGWIHLAWNATTGEPYAADPENEEKMLFSGDIEVKSKSQLDVAIDMNKDNSDHDWWIDIDWKNRYDLMAKYPELEEDIDAIPTKDHELNKFSFSLNKNFSSDDIRYFTFYHRKSEALPNGRMVVFLSDEVILYDGPLPYEKVHLYEIKPAPLFGSPFGYTPAFDLLAPQEAQDSLYSALLTNNLTFATQNIWTQTGTNLNVTHLPGQMNLLQSDVKPEPLQLTASAPETYKFLEILSAKQETLAGVNSVVRGNPEASLKSGAALALVASQAIQFNSRLQQAYIQLMEDVGTAIISLLKQYATVPRIAMIVGKHNRPYLKEFKGEDLEQINRVTVDVGSPVSKTTAGRVEMANQLLQTGLIKNPEEYLSVIQTGKLEPMIEGQTAELLLIRSENEKLREGESVSAVATEDHRLHVAEHKAVLANPESKLQPHIVQTTLNHINQHIDLLRQTDPGLLMLTGQQPLPPLQNPNAPAPPMPAGPPPNVEGAEGAVSPETLRQGVEDPSMPRQPTMPTNPLTGEKFNNETGGL
jgi:hypothetical protein